MGRRPYYVNTSPTAPFVANLFGIGVNPYKRGGFLLGAGPNDTYATPIFTPEAYRTRTKPS